MIERANFLSNYRSKFIPDEEAHIALSEQALRYNKGRRRNKRAKLSFGEYDSSRYSRDNDTSKRYGKLDHLALPDDVRADLDRQEERRKKGGFRNTVSRTVLSRQNALKFAAKDIVQVQVCQPSRLASLLFSMDLTLCTSFHCMQPATHHDPFSKDREKLGTATLRQSRTKYIKANSFSCIIPSIHGNIIQNHITAVDLTDKW